MPLNAIIVTRIMECGIMTLIEVLIIYFVIILMKKI